MKVHHLSCATMCPPLGRLVVHPTGLLTCHCMLVETPSSGLVLVDTGFGLLDVARPGRIGPLRHIFGLTLDESQTAARQVEALGFRREDVRHVVLTHLDLDHAGGLADFPDAEVHVLVAERAAARERSTLSESLRYRPEQWAHVPEAKWVLHEPAGDAWKGLRAARRIARCPPEILIVPLVGHTRGHLGVAVYVGGRWRLHCGDAYYFRGSLLGQKEPSLLARFEASNAMLPVAWAETRARLVELANDPSRGVDVASAHDPLEREWLAKLPVGAVRSAG